MSLLGYDHRYGFNGKEGDDEVKEDDNQQDYGMRIYDPRAGRFLSVDPIANKFPWNSPYSFAENDVIRNIDLDGKEKFSVALKNAKYEKGMAHIEVSTYVEVNLRIINLSSISFTDDEKTAISSDIKNRGDMFDGNFSNHLSYNLAFDPISGKQINDPKKFIRLVASGFINVDFKSVKFVNEYSEIESVNTLILALVDDIPKPKHEEEDIAGVAVRGSHAVLAEASFFKPELEKTNIIPEFGSHLAMHEIGHALGADHSCSACSDLMASKGNIIGFSIPEITRGEVGTYYLSQVISSNKHKLPFKNTLIKHFDYKIIPKTESESAIRTTNTKVKE